MDMNDEPHREEAPEADGGRMLHILPVGEPVLVEDAAIDPVHVPPEELPFTSWVVEESNRPDTVQDDGRPTEYLGPPEVLELDDSPHDPPSLRVTSADDGADTESIEAAIGRIYEVALGRAADADGLAFWSGVVADGATLDDIADAFAKVFAFEGESGDDVDDAEFVAGLYGNGLGRDADDAGLSFWLDRLADAETDRGDLIMAFADSDEVAILG